MTDGEDRMNFPTSYNLSTDPIVSFDQAEAWAVGAGGVASSI